MDGCVHYWLVLFLAASAGTAIICAILLWRKLGEVRRTLAREREQRLEVEAEREGLVLQLQQSQKMEAVGRLAGGVAHDFNNILTVINSFADIIHGEMEEGDIRRDDLGEIRKAGARAASLTRQLLAFSRRQVLQVEILDLNKVVANMEKMLHRLLGEDIELVTLPQLRLGRVKADPGQVDQVLLNLAVNARDAMPGGGKITVETRDVELDEAFAGTHLDVDPGSYVQISVSDTGQGMDAATLGQAFEPFFTTKKRGQGTGLGLSTVYGIVKQSGGCIGIYSEPGHGTTVKIYLPREDRPMAVKPRRATSELPGGFETILVVEDEEQVRKLVARVLTTAGYQVLSAACGEEARGLMERQAAMVDLVLTDMVMPGMNGRELARILCREYPEVRVLYMSGYTDRSVQELGDLEPGTHYLSKPFASRDLKQKVRQVLDEVA